MRIRNIRRSVAVLGLCVAPLLMGAVKSCGDDSGSQSSSASAKPKPKTQTKKGNDRITYRYDCNFEDFYGGVEMESWEGSGRAHPAASTDPFGALSRSAGEQPSGIGLHVRARSLTPVTPLPRGSRPRLECSVVKVNETQGTERTIGGPAHTSTRRAWLQVDARAS